MSKGNAFYEVFMQVEIPGNGTGDLCDFYTMSKTGAKLVAFMVHKDLGFVFQTAECAGVNDAVTVTLKLVAALWVRFWKLSAARLGRVSGVACKCCHGLGQCEGLTERFGWVITGHHRVTDALL